MNGLVTVYALVWSVSTHSLPSNLGVGGDEDADAYGVEDMEVEGRRGAADVRIGRVTGAINWQCEDDEDDDDDDVGDNDDDDTMCLFGSSS